MIVPEPMSSPEPAPPRLSVVIPVFNERLLVREAALELCARLDAAGIDYELILAENGSTDGTPEVLARLAEENPRIRWTHDPAPNYGRALRHGILAARGQFVVCDEIDLCDTEFYFQALPLLEQGADLVVGSKAMRGAEDHRPWIRRAATRVINGLLRLLLGFGGTDTHGQKAFLRDRLAEVARRCRVEKDLFASELVIRAGRMGRAVREIPVAVREKRPPSIHLFRRVPRVLAGLLRLFWAIRVRGARGA